MRRVCFCLFALLVVSSVFGVQVSFDTTGGNHFLFNGNAVFPFGWERISLHTKSDGSGIVTYSGPDTLAKIASDGYDHIFIDSGRWWSEWEWRHHAYPDFSPADSLRKDIGLLELNDIKGVLFLPTYKIGKHLYMGNEGDYCLDKVLTRIYGRGWRWGWDSDGDGDSNDALVTVVSDGKHYIDISGNNTSPDMTIDNTLPENDIVTVHNVKIYTGSSSIGGSPVDEDKAMQGMNTELKWVLEFNFPSTF